VRTVSWVLLTAEHDKATGDRNGTALVLGDEPKRSQIGIGHALVVREKVAHSKKCVTR
jgi:hypothetical protein